MKKKWQLIAALLLALVVSGGLFAYTYTTASATLAPEATKGEIATVAKASGQPDWNSIITPEAGGTEYLRPSAAGDETNISSQYPASGEHWQKVDEESFDGDSTYVSTESWGWQEDLYNIANHSAGSGAINYVKVYMVGRTEVAPTQTTAYVHIKTGGVEVNGVEETMTTGYGQYSSPQWNTNPVTGKAWTWAEIDALQIGVGLRQPAWFRYTRCTQVYAVVNYGGGIALCGDVPTGNLFDITPEATYTGDLQARVYLTNTGALIKAYQYLNMKLYLEGSVEAGEDPDYRLLTLENGVATFNLKDYLAGGTYTLSVGTATDTGGSYCLISTDPGAWDPDYELEPKLYCEVTQSQ